MVDIKNYSCDCMDIDIYSSYLSESESNELFRKIIQNPIHFKNSSLTKAGIPSKKETRQSMEV
jgi:hypothetical protein